MRKNRALKPEDEKKFELCICCRKRMMISKEEPIDYRAFYIEGAGQLCYDCYHKIYG